jgi:predicted nucleic acid-binding protein
LTLVVDASVAVKWVLLEPDSERARALVGSEPLIAPDFLMLESANVLAGQVRRRNMDRETAAAGLRTIAAAGVRLTPTAPLVPEAQRLAMTLGQTVYDSLYLALALAEPAMLITADTRFASALATSSAHAQAVRLLSG